MHMISRDNSTGAFQVVIDFACICAGYFLAEQLVTWLSSKQLFIFPRSAEWTAQYSTLVLIGLLSWTGVSAYTGIYHSHRSERLAFAATGLLRALVLWTMMTTGGVFLLKLHKVSRQFTLYFLLFSGALIVLRQLTVMLVMRRLRRFGYNWRTALVVGDSGSCQRFAKLLTTTYPMGFRVALVPLNGAGTLPAEQLPDADDAFLIAAGLANETHALRFLKQGKSVHIVPEFLDARLFRQALGDVAGVPVISLSNGKLSSVQAAAKRAADITGALALLVVLAPVYAVIAAITKLISPGPVLFSQVRLGKNGKPFKVYKFRTMVADAERILKSTPALYEKYVANNFKLPESQDPRVTRLGSFLRSTSLDELPQLFNVLKGEMSLVGPRPVVPAEVEKYGDYATLFLSAKPGMTGHWQVSGRSEIEEYARRVELDLEYLRDQSLGKDFEILLRTVPAVLLRKGAH